jgi:tRNA/tmRNA/rRNA uracil-C5-methylase (TrmA/RlmC/RlmD family)
LESLTRAHGLSGVAVVSGASTGFRLRARLAIRGRPGAPRLGMFELGTHRVVHIPNCVVQHPLINRVAAVVRRALVHAEIAPYAETVHRGLARYLQVVVERRSESAQVVIVGTARQSSVHSCFELPIGSVTMHSLWFNAQCERTSTIRDAVHALVRSAECRTLRWSSRALPPWRVRPEQSRRRGTHR